MPSSQQGLLQGLLQSLTPVLVVVDKLLAANRSLSVEVGEGVLIGNVEDSMGLQIKGSLVPVLKVFCFPGLGGLVHNYKRFDIKELQVLSSEAELQTAFQA